MQEHTDILRADLYQRSGGALPPVQGLHCHGVDGQHKAAGCAEDVASDLRSTIQMSMLTTFMWHNVYHDAITVWAI